LEQRLAAQWAGYQWREFKALDGDEQAATIATYRANFQIEAVLSEDSARKSKAKKPGKKPA
jgi:hypothetical protein